MSLYTLCFSKTDVAVIKHAIEQEMDKVLKSPLESNPYFPHQRELDLQRLTNIIQELDELPICVTSIPQMRTRRISRR